MRSFLMLWLILWGFGLPLNAQQPVQDDFEGNGTITTWAPDGLGIDTSLPNPLVNASNPSATVLKYHDNGGQYANVRFDVADNFDLSTNHTFTLKIYLPSSGLTGNSPNQVSLKLQNGNLAEPWNSQCEVVKSVALDQWQTLDFDFANDPYVNFNPNSPPPIQRPDFSRVLIQVNGEDNSDHVLAYIDDVAYDGTVGGNSNSQGSIYDVLVWSDEFDGAGPVDASQWWAQTQLPNGDSWWGGERQHYTDRPDNAFVEDGILHIVAKQERYTDQGVTKQYTSARLNSKFAFTYGRVEVRAKLPTGVGTLPAIWMLGRNINEIGAYWQTQGYGAVLWPDCGEVDIMEHWGDNLNYVSSATHTPSSHGNTINVGGQVVPTATTAFHLYSLEWTPDKMVLAVDGKVNLLYQPGVQNADTWPFDAPMYLLLNIAILPTIVPSFTESTMEIDYVRIYQSTSQTTQKKQLASEATSVYPNPLQEAIFLNLPAALGQEVEFSLYDLTGRLVKRSTQRVTQPTVTLDDLADLPAGPYFLRFTYQKKNHVVRLLKP